MDDILALITSDIWFSPTPYRNGSTLLSNGSAHPYDREKDTIVTNETFADCAEMALRHISNLLFYNRTARGWDLSSITDQDTNIYFTILKQFYRAHSIRTANAGDTGTRSQWNKVVGDINSNEPDETKIRYVKDTYEISGGFENLINIFAKLLGLSLGKPAENIEAKKAWVANSLNSIFKKMNTNYSYEISYKDSYVKDNIFSGTIKVQVSQGKEDIFGFDLFSHTGHTEIRHFRTFLKDNKENYDAKILQNYRELLEPFFLLSDKKPFKNKISLPLYKLLGQPIDEENKRVNFLKALANFAPEDLDERLFTTLDALLKNIGQNIQLDDVRAFRQSLPILMDLLLHTKFSESAYSLLKSSLKSNEIIRIFIEDLSKADHAELSQKGVLVNDLLKCALQNSISSSSISSDFFLLLEPLRKPLFNQTIQELFSQITNLQLDMKKETYLNTDTLKCFPNLKILSLINITLVGSKLDFNSLQNLEEIVLQNIRGAENIDLSSLTRVKRITLNGIRDLSELSLLNELLNVEYVSLSMLPEIKSINMENLQYIKHLTIENCANIGFIKMKNLSRLSSFNIGRLYYLNDLILENIETLSLLIISDLPFLKEIDGFEKLTNLRNLQINGSEDSPSKLENINIENMSKLNEISIRHSSGIEKINGINAISNLRKLYLFNVTYLKKFSVSNLKNLSEITVSDCKDIISESDIEGLTTLQKEGNLRKILINEDDEPWTDI